MVLKETTKTQVRILQHLADKLQVLSGMPPERTASSSSSVSSPSPSSVSDSPSNFQHLSSSTPKDFLRLTAECRRLVEVLLMRHVAVCMGQHRRLGAERCPHTSIYVSPYCHICVLTYECIRCSHTSAYVAVCMDQHRRPWRRKVSYMHTVDLMR